jgi:molybdopterin molybdotransferase
MIELHDAQRRILDACAPLAVERVALAAALGRVLAREALAADDIVPFPRSAMDGFAVRAADTLPAPCELRVAASVYAEPGLPVAFESGTAVPVATGAQIPLGADAVLPVEEVQVRDGLLRVLLPTFPGRHIFPPGDDAKRDDVLVRAGERLTPGALGLLAAAGFAEIEVVRRPLVAIVCTGDELVRVGDAPAYGQIRNSNATVVAAYVAALGAEVVSNVHVGDDRSAIEREVRAAVARADLVVTTGGASVGERDFLKPIARALGASFAFESVAIRPARPSAFATLGDTRIAILPGNPAAVFVALVELVGPALRALQGAPHPLPARIHARLRGDVRAKHGRTYLPFVAVRHSETGFEAELLENQCSALTRTAADADGLAVITAQLGELGSGTVVPVDVYSWSRLSRSGDAAENAGARAQTRGI